MVLGSRERQVVDVGWAAGRPLVDMVDFTPVFGRIAAGRGAATIFRIQNHTLIR